MSTRRYPGGWTHTRSNRQSLTDRVAGWYPPLAAAITVLVGLVFHEIAYHATEGMGGDYPLTVAASGTRVFVMSHGALDSLGVGFLAVMVLVLIDKARARKRKGTP